jgi:gas vesicle protein
MHERRAQMPEETASSRDSKLVYLLIGLGLGSLISILFAPKSGGETREYLTGKANELKKRAAMAVEQGENVITDRKERLIAAIDTGREVYKQEIAKAKAAGTTNDG